MLAPSGFDKLLIQVQQDSWKCRTLSLAVSRIALDVHGMLRAFCGGSTWNQACHKPQIFIMYS